MALLLIVFAYACAEIAAGLFEWIFTKPKD